MVRRAVLIAFTSGLVCLGGASAAGATTTSLVLGQGAAFSVLGHSCGGVQEHPYATGFGPGGYPGGDVYLKTSCGGSGRGGGYKTTTYSAWASVTWDWYGDTRSYGRLEGAPTVSTTFSEEDGKGDRLYNTATAAFLETTSPPTAPPAAPTNVTAAQSDIEVGETLQLRFQVDWTPAPETAALITSSTVTATPVGSTAPVVAATVSGGGSGVIVGPLQPQTTYRITVTNTDPEGTSAPSAPIEATTPNEDGETGGGPPPQLPPEFGHCVKVSGGGVYTTSNCETESRSETGTYNWVPGVSKEGFTIALKPTTTVKLETSATREKVICTGERSSGAITGVKSVGSVVITLTGCESLSGKCTTAGLAEGELQTAILEGVLGIERTTEKLGKEVAYAALELKPVGGIGPFLEYDCSTTSGMAILSGAIIAPIPSGKTAKTGIFKLAESAGRQKPESFEGGLLEVLTNASSEQVGVSLSATLAYEEALEVNPVV